MAEKTTLKGEPVRMVEVAVLDANRVFQGTARIPERDVTDQHVVLSNGCDLEPGTHRHDPDANTFVPIDGSVESAAEDNPEVLRSVALGFICLHDQGMTLPRETLKWLDWYITTVDFSGKFDGGTVAMVKRYREARGGK